MVMRWGKTAGPPTLRPLRIGRIILSLLCLLAAAAAYSDLQFGDFTYTTDGTSVTITGYSGAGGAVHIPEIIDDKPVTGIEEFVFRYRDELISITIPDSVTNIENYAFYYCANLTSVIIGNSVTTIGNNAFDSCTSLTGTTIGSSVTTIESYAFYGTGLTRVTIPDRVTSIGESAFESCSSLTGVYCQSNAPGLGSNVFSDTPATIYYTLGTAGWTNPWGDRPTVLWNPVIQLDDGSFGVLAGEFGFNIAESVSGLVVVKACTNLIDGIWVPVETNSMNNSSVYFSDPDWGNHAARFYRLSMP